MKKLLLLYLLFIVNFTKTANNFPAIANSFAVTSTMTNQAYFVSVFGTQEAEQQFDNLSVQFQYGIPSSVLTTTLLNGGTATTANSCAILQTSGSVGSFAGIESLTALRYITGHEAHAFFTAAFTGPTVANTTQYIGILDSSEGFAVGYKGTSFGILFRNGGAESFIPQSSFNADTLDGTGPSGFLYNRSNLNIFRIAYGWLGAAAIKFHIMNSNGNWILFHVIQQPGASPNPSIRNPMLPMSAEVFDPSGGTQLAMRTASWNMAVVDINDKVGNRPFTVITTASISANSEQHVLTIQNQNTFQGSVNAINITIAYPLAVRTSGGTSSLIMRLYKNATVTGTSFVPVNANTSVTKYSIDGTYTPGTGTVVFIAPATPSSSGKNIILPPSVYTIILYPGEQLTLTVQTLGPGSTITGGLQWTEGF